MNVQPRELNETEAEIAHTTEALLDKAQRLERRFADARARVEHAVDVREQVRERPWVWVGRAFTAGLIVGLLQR